MPLDLQTSPRPSGGSPDPRQPPFGVGTSPIHRVMCSPRLSAGGLRFLGHRFPLRCCALLASGLPAGRTSSGFPRSATTRIDRGGCPLYRGSQVSFGPRVSGGDPAESPLPSAPAPSSPRQPLRRPMNHAASSRVHSRSPVRSPPGLTPPSAGSSLGRYHPLQTISLPTGSGMVGGGPWTQTQRCKSRSP